MGMMIVAKKLDEDANRVRYSFGLDERFDRVLVIDKATWNVASADGGSYLRTSDSWREMVSDEPFLAKNHCGTAT